MHIANDFPFSSFRFGVHPKSINPPLFHFTPILVFSRSLCYSTDLIEKRKKERKKQREREREKERKREIQRDRERDRERKREREREFV